ncbi:hypothetical protein PCYB_145890 [Plasmodium cynomolgi strain B]|uniref:Uncharacterized protein n=1 Tax=Plasmodium cynomolgi (strain B) TaxID=1120755 RepID=K6UEY5_PLACD|nr:hypothetical protein PCYB_145890 [Plasmodium cynomolgi strain B]GAB69161.1 hypothetical protein PCYB_145890 [Plasmodium cynomolgi strain B]
MENHLVPQENVFNRSNVFSHFSLNSVTKDSFDDAYSAANRVSSVCSNSCEASVGTRSVSLGRTQYLGRSPSMGGSLHEVSPVASPLAAGATTDVQNRSKNLNQNGDPFSRNNTCSAYGRDPRVERMDSNHCSVLLPRLIHNDMSADANHHLGVPPLMTMTKNNSFNRCHEFSEASTKCLNLRRGVDMRVISPPNSASANGGTYLGNEHIFMGSNSCRTINGFNDPCPMEVDASNGLYPPNVATNQIGSYNYDLLTFKQPTSLYDGINDAVVKGRPDDVSYGYSPESVRGENNYMHLGGGHLNSDEEFGSGSYSNNINLVRTKGFSPHVTTGHYGKDSRSSTTTSVLNEEMLVGSGFSRWNINMKGCSSVDTLRESVLKFMAMKLQSNNGVGSAKGMRSIGHTGDMVCNTGCPSVNPSGTNNDCFPRTNYDCFPRTDYDSFPRTNRSSTQLSSEQRRCTTLPQMKLVQTGGPHRSVYPGGGAPSKKPSLKSSDEVNTYIDSDITNRRAAIPRVASPRMVEALTSKKLRSVLPLIIRPLEITFRAPSTSSNCALALLDREWPPPG